MLFTQVREKQEITILHHSPPGNLWWICHFQEDIKFLEVIIGLDFSLGKLETELVLNLVELLFFK